MEGLISVVLSHSGQPKKINHPLKGQLSPRAFSRCSTNSAIIMCCQWPQEGHHGKRSIPQVPAPAGAVSRPTPAWLCGMEPWADRAGRERKQGGSGEGQPRAEDCRRKAQPVKSRCAGQSLHADTWHPGGGQRDLMLVVTPSGPLPAPPSASALPRGSRPSHPCPSLYALPPLHTQRDKQIFSAKTSVEAYCLDTFGMGKANSFHFPEGSGIVNPGLRAAHLLQPHGERVLA